MNSARLVPLALAGCLAACTPTLDWREVRPIGSAVVAMFPCKPASHARQVSLAGRVVELTLYACTAGEVTYALAYADMRDPGDVGKALSALKTSAWSNVRATPPSTTPPMQQPGMTPNAESVRWQVVGALPNGQSVQEAGAVFAHGTWVYQATAIGARLDASAMQTFLDALRVAS